MTKNEVLALADELAAEERKTKKIPHYYKRHGEWIERSYPDYVYTARYSELIASDSPLNTEAVFIDAETHKAYTYNELETWYCDFENDSYISSAEYEDEMGEDL